MDFTPFFVGFSIILQWKFVLYMFGGVFFGLLLGALPGLTGTLGIALMLPFTYTMDALSSLVFLLSIYTGGLFGGAITAILINTPGSPANIATLLDGYPMTKKGMPDRALGLALFSSVIGGLIGCFFLLIVTEPMANLSLRFGPAEMFMVAVFGLSIVASLGEDNMLKGIFGALFGLLLGTIGMNANAIERGTFGILYLLDGVPLIPTLIGFLSIPEIVTLVNQNFVVDKELPRSNLLRLLGSFKELLKRPLLTVSSSMMGVLIGVIPAAGATIASLFCYNQAKQFSKHPKLFGTGVPEGIIASETGNNASEGGALATMLILGIPGSASTAILIGALILQGWVPGPRMFIDNKEIIYASISSLFVQQFVMLLIGLLICLYAYQILKIPVKYIIPCVFVFSIIGAFANRNAMFDAYLMVIFGVIAYLLKKFSFPVMPVVLGIILGPMADRELLRVVQMFRGEYGTIFQRPIVLVLLVATVASIFAPLFLNRRRKTGDGNSGSPA